MTIDSGKKGFQSLLNTYISNLFYKFYFLPEVKIIFFHTIQWNACAKSWSKSEGDLTSACGKGKGKKKHQDEMMNGVTIFCS
jgi:hypothetical protein